MTKDRVIVGWRAPVTPDGIGVEEKSPIHIADLLRMTQTTPGQQPEDPPGQDQRQVLDSELATPFDQQAGRSVYPAAAQSEPGPGIAVKLVETAPAACAQPSPDVQRARKRSGESMELGQSKELATTEKDLLSYSGRGVKWRSIGPSSKWPLFAACDMDVQFAAMVHTGMHWTESPVPKTHEEAMSSPGPRIGWAPNSENGSLCGIKTSWGSFSPYRLARK